MAFVNISSIKRTLSALEMLSVGITLVFKGRNAFGNKILHYRTKSSSFTVSNY